MSALQATPATTPATESFADYQSRKLQEGFDEVLLREWAAGFANDTHTHPFDTDAIVAQGEFWLSIGGEVLHYGKGDRFQVARNVPHSERYGAQGAMFWAARRN